MAYLPPSTYLQPGSTDTASVKQLQDYLVGGGFLTEAQKGTGYGIYGPQTTAAVAALQKSLGVDNSTGVGYFGPRTIAALSGATPQQGNSIASSLNSGNVNQYGIPKDIGSILGVSSSVPTPNTPIDAAGLTGGANTGNFNDILAAALNNPNPNSSIAGLLSLYGVTSDQQKEYDAMNQQLLDVTKSLGGEDADLQKALEAQGVPAAFQHVKELNLQAAQLKGELDAFDVDTEKGLASIEDQPVTARVVSGQQARLQKQRNLEKMAKAAELSAVVGLAQAYQGNAELGTQLATQSVKLKYAPILSSLDVIKTQLGISKERLSKSDSTRANIIGGLIDLQKTKISTQQKNETQIQSLAIEAATNGAPLSVVRAIQAATDPVTAASVGASYVKGNLESIAGNGSGGSGGGGTGGGGKSTGTFTSTQQNKGASVANLDLKGFNALPYEVKNYFVNNNGAKEFIAAIQDIRTGAEDVQSILDELDSSGLPDPVVTYLKQQAQAAAPAGSGGGGGFLGAVGNFFGGAWNSVKNVLGL